MFNFKDKTVIVTGGAQGIGRCITEEFCKAGAHVCVIDRQPAGRVCNPDLSQGVYKSFPKLDK